MNLEENITKSILEYPGLYLCKTYKESRLEVLDHLFNTLGGGYGWHKETGTLIEDECAQYRNFNDEGWAYSGRIQYEKIPEEIMTEENFERLIDTIPPEPPCESRIKMWEIIGRGKGEPYPQPEYQTAYGYYEKLKGFSGSDKEYSFDPYPIGHNGNLYYIPDNISDDYLQGAEEILAANIEFYENNGDDYDNVLGGDKRTPAEVNQSCMNALFILAEIKEKIETIKRERK
jgi:hypothetical protein